MSTEENLFIQQYTSFQAQVTAKKIAWENFMRGNILPPEDIIPPQISASWQRSKNAGLNPFDIQSTYISPSELEQRQNANADLINATIPIFESFAKQMLDEIYTVDIYDKDLIFIKTYGRNIEMLSNRKGYSDPGLNRSENFAATTAMNLAIETGKPFQLIGPEHYDFKLHQRSCTAVPIYSPENSLVGVINMAEKCTPNSRHTLAIIIAFGKGVEYNLLQMQEHKRLEDINYFNSAILETMGQAIIVINSEGRIDMANKAALLLLHVNAKDFISASSETIFGPGNIFIQVLQNNATVVNREISLCTNGVVQYFTGTITPIVSEISTIRGVIGTLNDMTSTKRMLKNIGGWNAKLTFENIIGESPALLQIIELARQTANLPSNTLIQGESGTGKEIFAQAIHNASNYRNGPFIAVNCAAIPITLLESELFGYESGAYTGAKKGGQPGKFELAEGGTIFLDEINSMPLDMQVKLLRVLQNKTIVRIGGTSTISLNVKIIVASNANLSELVAQGHFRADLFYRLNVITINLPPLRDRLEDIPALTKYILNRISSNTSAAKQIQIADDALDLLKKYSWPGNIRELENLLERAVVRTTISENCTIDLATLLSFPEFIPARQVTIGTRPANICSDSPFLKTSEENAIREAFLINHWNISKAAKFLGIARNTLYKKMREYNIEKPD